MEDNIIYLIDESGEEVPFELLDTIEFEGDEYVVLMAIDPSDDSEDSDIFILKSEQSDNSCEVSLTTVEDEDLADKIFDLFVEKHPDEFDYSDMQ